MPMKEWHLITPRDVDLAIGELRKGGRSVWPERWTRFHSLVSPYEADRALYDDPRRYTQPVTICLHPLLLKHEIRWVLDGFLQLGFVETDVRGTLRRAPQEAERAYQRKKAQRKKRKTEPGPWRIPERTNSFGSVHSALQLPLSTEVSDLSFGSLTVDDTERSETASNARSEASLQQENMRVMELEGRLLELTTQLRSLRVNDPLQARVVPKIVERPHVPLLASVTGNTPVCLELNFLDPDLAPYGVDCGVGVVLPCVITGQRFITFIAPPHEAGCVPLTVVCGNPPCRYCKSVWLEYKPADEVQQYALQLPQDHPRSTRRRRDSSLSASGSSSILTNKSGALLLSAQPQSAASPPCLKSPVGLVPETDRVSIKSAPAYFGKRHKHRSRKPHTGVGGLPSPSSSVATSPSGSPSPSPHPFPSPRRSGQVLSQRTVSWFNDDCLSHTLGLGVTEPLPDPVLPFDFCRSFLSDPCLETQDATESETKSTYSKPASCYSDDRSTSGSDDDPDRNSERPSQVNDADAVSVASIPSASSKSTVLSRGGRGMGLLSQRNKPSHSEAPIPFGSPSSLSVNSFSGPPTADDKGSLHADHLSLDPDCPPLTRNILAWHDGATKGDPAAPKPGDMATSRPGPEPPAPLPSEMPPECWHESSCRSRESTPPTAISGVDLGHHLEVLQQLQRRKVLSKTGPSYGELVDGIRSATTVYSISPSGSTTSLASLKRCRPSADSGEDV